MITDSPTSSTGSDRDGPRLVRFANQCNVIPDTPSNVSGRQRSASRTRMVVRRDTTLWSMRVPTIGFVSTPPMPHSESPELPSAMRSSCPHPHCESTPIAELLPTVDPPTPQLTPRTPPTIPEDPMDAAGSSPRQTFSSFLRIGRQNSIPPTPMIQHSGGYADDWDENELIPLRPCCAVCYAATEHPARAIRWTARAFRAWKEYSGPQDVKKREAEEEERKAHLSAEMSPSPRPLSFKLNVDEVEVLKKHRMQNLNMPSSSSPVTDLPDEPIAPSPATDSSSDSPPFSNSAKPIDPDEFPLPKRGSNKSSAATSPSASASALPLSSLASASKEVILPTMSQDAMSLSLPLVGKSSRTSLLRNSSRTSLRKSGSRPGSSASIARLSMASPLSQQPPTSRPESPATSDADALAAALAKSVAEREEQEKGRWTLGSDSESASESEEDVFHDSQEDVFGRGEEDGVLGRDGVPGMDGLLGKDGTLDASEDDVLGVSKDGLLGASISRRAPPPVVTERPSRPASSSGMRPSSTAGSLKGSLKPMSRPGSRPGSMHVASRAGSYGNLNMVPGARVSGDAQRASTSIDVQRPSMGRSGSASQLQPYAITTSRPLSTSSQPLSTSSSGPSRPSSRLGQPSSRGPSRPSSRVGQRESRARGRPASRASDVAMAQAGSRSASRASTEKATGRTSVEKASGTPPSAFPTVDPADYGLTNGLSSADAQTLDVLPQTPKIPSQIPNLTCKIPKGDVDGDWVALSVDDAASLVETSESRPTSPLLRMMRSLSRGPKKRRAYTTDMGAVTPSGSSTSSSEAPGSSSILQLVRSRSRGPASRSQGVVSREGSGSDATELQSNNASLFGMMRSRSRSSGGAARKRAGTPAANIGAPSASPSPEIPPASSKAAPSSSTADMFRIGRSRSKPPMSRNASESPTKGRSGPTSVVPPTLARASTERRAQSPPLMGAGVASPISPPRRNRAASTGSILQAQDLPRVHVDGSGRQATRQDPAPPQTKPVPPTASRRTTSFSTASARSLFNNVNLGAMLRGVSVGLGGGHSMS
ncbi:hypothetical protein BD626DRAFT_629944 [Schizophyllum amplum]|uniref:Uncharacterized protein n=1 Tax=Schizophyllum amplum TaxID=97359 RepID=A0A550CF23_9AGAR|nr:hypothetical protein BD626DRAFT_629944 [Auriculariopsis ampla]